MKAKTANAGPGPKQQLYLQFAEMAKALGHAHRLEILELLAQGECGRLARAHRERQRQPVDLLAADADALCAELQPLVDELRQRASHSESELTGVRGQMSDEKAKAAAAAAERDAAKQLVESQREMNEKALRESREAQTKALNDLGEDRFGVQLIPETQARTTLADRAVGERYNVEADVIGKYVARLHAAYAPRAASSGGLTVDMLRAAGFGLD